MEKLTSIRSSLSLHLLPQILLIKKMDYQTPLTKTRNLSWATKMATASILKKKPSKAKTEVPTLPLLPATLMAVISMVQLRKLGNRVCTCPLKLSIPSLATGKSRLESLRRLKRDRPAMEDLYSKLNSLTCMELKLKAPSSMKPRTSLSQRFSKTKFICFPMEL
jgi:hypothetical protein